jgi:hypothetical protein
MFSTSDGQSRTIGESRPPASAVVAKQQRKSTSMSLPFFSVVSNGAGNRDVAALVKLARRDLTGCILV